MLWLSEGFEELPSRVVISTNRLTTLVFEYFISPFDEYIIKLQISK